MTRRAARCLFATESSLVLLPLSAQGWPQGYSVRTVALDGEPAPVGGTHQSFLRREHRDLDASNRLAFGARTSGGDRLVALGDDGTLVMALIDFEAIFRHNPKFPRLLNPTRPIVRRLRHQAERLASRYVRVLMPLAFLAPDIVAAILPQEPSRSVCSQRY